MTVIAATPPATTLCSFTVFNSDMSIVPGVEFNFQLVDPMQPTNAFATSLLQSATSDSNGLVQIKLGLGMRWKMVAPDNRFIFFTPNTADNFTLPEYIGIFPASNSTIDLSLNLIAAYQNYTGGEIWLDSSGSTPEFHNLLKEGNITQVPGQLSYGVQSVNDSISSSWMQTSPIVDSVAFTFTCWINPAIQTDTFIPIYQGDLPSNVTNQFIYYTGSSPYLAYNVDIFGGDTVPANQWSFVGVTYDGTNATLYLNGLQIANGAVDNLYFGNTVFTIFQPVAVGMGDSVSDIFVWSRCLAANEISLLWNGGYGRSPF